MLIYTILSDTRCTMWKRLRGNQCGPMCQSDIHAWLWVPLVTITSWERFECELECSQPLFWNELILVRFWATIENGMELSC